MEKIDLESPQTINGLNYYRYRVKELYQELNLGGTSLLSADFLMNREQVGIPLRYKLEELFNAISEPAILIIDFLGVREMTGSVAEEIGPILFGTVQNHRKVNPEKYLVYDNLSQEVQKELDAWFARYEQCVPAFPHDSSSNQSIIGALPPQNLRDVIDYCYSKQVVTSSDLEREITAASKKLKDIQSQYPWLLRRNGKVNGETPRSWRYQFIPITPLDRWQSKERLDMWQSMGKLDIWQSAEQRHREANGTKVD